MQLLFVQKFLPLFPSQIYTHQQDEICFGKATEREREREIERERERDKERDRERER